MRRRPERLAALRIARGATQAEVAERAGWQQAAVSRLEVRADDAKVSTIRRYIESIGGELRVVAVFRGGDERIVKLREASDVDD
jgi:predicted transcriptional regulator